MVQEKLSVWMGSLVWFSLPFCWGLMLMVFDFTLFLSKFGRGGEGRGGEVTLDFEYETNDLQINAELRTRLAAYVL